MHNIRSQSSISVHVIPENGCSFDGIRVYPGTGERCVTTPISNFQLIYNKNLLRELKYYDMMVTIDLHSKVGWQFVLHFAQNLPVFQGGLKTSKMFPN